MSVAPTDRGTALLVAHCTSFDPAAPTARERLDEALGPDLARKLVFALSGCAQESERTPGALRARAVFAA